VAFLFIYTMKITALHIEPTNICTLRCAGCARTRLIKHAPDLWKNHSIDPGALMRFLDVDLTGVSVKLSGVYGDPIYHPNILDMVAGLKRRGCHLIIVTNGSYKTGPWWQDLCALLDAQDCVTFSIDGLPENFHIYRENGDWPSIKQGIETCVAAGVRTVWKYLVFRFNQLNIDQARELSQTLGMSRFLVNHSDRFDQYTEQFEPDPEYLGSKMIVHEQFRAKSDFYSAVDPKCSDGSQHFITAQGHYVACCHIADYRFYEQTLWGQQRDHFQISATTLSSVLSAPAVIDFYQNIPKNPVFACQWNCPAAS